MDICATLAHRRWVASPAREHYAAKSIHVTLGASPMTGRELDMMWFVCTRESWEWQTLLGSCLAYWYVACIDKLMAFLWVLFLVCGSMDTMESVLQTIRSFTTDQDVEAGIPFMGDPRVRKEILKWSRTFPLSTHIHDWHHLRSGCLKSAFSSFLSGPENLKHLRTVFTFFSGTRTMRRRSRSVLCPWVGQSWVISLVRSRPASHSGDLNAGLLAAPQFGSVEAFLWR